MKDPSPILDSPVPPGNPPRRRAFWNGVLSGAAYYAAGLTLSTIVSWLVPHTYPHGPGLHHILILFTFAGGLVWTFVSALRLLISGGSRELKGSLAVNTLALLGFFIFMYAALHPEEHPPKEPSGEITMERRGDTTSVFVDGNLVVLQVKDSVLMNLSETVPIMKYLDSINTKVPESK